MLEYVYPRPAPSLSTLRFATVKALFSASRRYEVWRAIDASVAQLKALAPAQPFVVYSIAMHAREDCLSPTGGQVGLVRIDEQNMSGHLLTRKAYRRLARLWRRRPPFTHSSTTSADSTNRTLRASAAVPRMRYGELLFFFLAFCSADRAFGVAGLCTPTDLPRARTSSSRCRSSRTRRTALRALNTV